MFMPQKRKTVKKTKDVGILFRDTFFLKNICIFTKKVVPLRAIYVNIKRINIINLT